MKTDKDIEQLAAKAQHGRKVWIAITVITLAVSLALNIAYPFTFKPDPVPNMPLTPTGSVLLALLAGLLPVAMQALMSHAIFTPAPWPVKVIAFMIFAIGMIMSVTHQYALFAAAVEAVTAAGAVATIDVSALTALFMIERGNRIQKAAERAAAERARQARASAEHERRERQLAAERATQRAEDERLAELQLANERAAAERARLALESAERAAEAERLAIERADRERQLEAERAAAASAEAERLENERRAAAEAAKVEQARAERVREQARLDRERQEKENAERERRAAERAERQARAELAERGDLPYERKREIAREMLQANPGVNATQVAEEVKRQGGKWSPPQARKVLAALKDADGVCVAEVHDLRQATAV